MSLPDFNSEGDLPPGVHAATIDEVTERFGESTVQRVRLATTLRRILELALDTGRLDRLILFGSFVTSKPIPNDVDVILVMQDEFRLEVCPLKSAALFDHSQAESEFRASVFWIRPGLLILDTLEQFVDRWQLKREGGVRGIIEVKG